MRKIIVGFICSLVFVANVWAEGLVTNYGPTTSSDTIWNIAIKFRPNEEVAVSQVVLGIFNANRDAFRYDNINALDDGKIIKIPDISVIRAIEENKANKEIVVQNRKWQQVLQDQKRQKRMVMEKKLVQPPVAVASVPAVIPTVTAGEIVENLTNRLVESEAKNNAAQTQLAELGERINALEKNINQLVMAEKQKKNSSVSMFFAVVQQRATLLSEYLGQKLFMGIVAGIVLILLLLLIFLIMPQRKDGSAGYPRDDSSSKGDDFDPLSGNEGMAAKLNLARAYIEMGQESKAQAMLYEVLSHGSDDEQAEAKTLLEKIKDKNLCE